MKSKNAWIYYEITDKSDHVENSMKMWKIFYNQGLTYSIVVNIDCSVVPNTNWSVHVCLSYKSLSSDNTLISGGDLLHPIVFWRKKEKRTRL